MKERSGHYELLLIVSSLLLSWLGMMAVHEFGHVLAAWATGGQVTKVVLHPLAISRTDVSPNPQQLAVAWSGPLFGVLFPFLVFAAAKRLIGGPCHLLRFFSGFCLIANGVYIGIGSFQRIGDAGDLLRHGSQAWLLWLFGLTSAALGLVLWNGVGAGFGVGPKAEPVSPRRAYTALLLVGLIVLIEALLSPMN